MSKLGVLHSEEVEMKVELGMAADKLELELPYFFHT